MLLKSTAAVMGLFTIGITATAAEAPAAAQPLYRLVQSIPLGSPDRWDYLAWAPVSGPGLAAERDPKTG